jgi:hypothetical protein
MASRALVTTSVPLRREMRYEISSHNPQAGTDISICADTRLIRGMRVLWKIGGGFSLAGRGFSLFRVFLDEAGEAPDIETRRSYKIFGSLSAKSSLSQR